MSAFLGIDTSNYTTSLAISENNSIVKNLKKVLKVDEGKRGLRQSDAVFAHTVNLAEMFKQLGEYGLSAIGVSAFPRDVKGSYMPCFLSGVSVASAISGINGIPMYEFSHQWGHIAAALYSCKREDLLHKEFLAFHISGGTSELVHVKNMNIDIIGGTKDISAGQLIDRAGVLMGLSFPCGKAMEELTSDIDIDAVRKDKISVDGFRFNLSGLENKVQKHLSSGMEKTYISAYVISSVCSVIEKMTEQATIQYPNLPIVYSGGVMSNGYIKKKLSEKFGGLFALPDFSCDNAAGTARLAELKFNCEI